MPQGLETNVIGADAAVDPVILLLVLCAFLIGAVAPFVVCILGSLREERAMHGYAADYANTENEPTAVANPVSDDVVPATTPLTLDAPDAVPPANDHVKTANATSLSR